MSLPRVLLIGDSISIGYTPYVQEGLDGIARVDRNKGNAQFTGVGLQKIDEWLGDVPWNVIHFNWGLWDMYGWEYTHEDRSPETYGARLQMLVERMQKTGAHLIWATTTPACPGPEISMRERFDTLAVIGESEERLYHETAESVMRTHGVSINNLYDAILPSRAKFSLGNDNVHYDPAGYRFLGNLVAQAIRERL